jgi:nucleoside-diphosphate-sugar epimerase
MNKKRMLICGATGFIGRNLLERYANDERYEVRAVYHHREPLREYDVDWILADLNNPTDVKLCIEGMDIVLQFAATTSGAGDIVSRPYIHVTDNAVMNSLILRECYEQNVGHFVFPSCTVMYQPSEDALKETDFDGNQPLLPKYFGVGNTKVYIEKMCDFYSRLGRTKHTVLRHSNIYGPHDKYDLKRSHVFGATVTKVLTADDKITVWGTGEEKRDLLYVEDLMDFIESALQNQTSSYELYNVGYGSAISIKNLVSKIIDISGRELKVEHDLSKPTIKTNVHLDCAKALNELNWSPRTSLEDGIRLTIEWYRKNIL